MQSIPETKTKQRKRRAAARQRVIYLKGTYETRREWERALKELAERIEAERAKIIPLKLRALARPRARKQIKVLEELIVEFMRLKLAGQEAFPEA